MSSSTTGTPALATWAAMPAPITPAPRTPTLRMPLAGPRPAAGVGGAHHTASSTVAIPWPPPMHWVASA